MKKLIFTIFLSLLFCFPTYGADKKIPELTALEAKPASDDKLVVYDSSTGITKRVDYTYLEDIKNVNLYGGLTAAVTAIGATETTLLITDSQIVAADLSIPTTMQLFITRGGDIAVAGGEVLTINGTILAGAYQIFSGAGTVTYSGTGIFLGTWISGGDDSIIVDIGDFGTLTGGLVVFTSAGDITLTTTQMGGGLLIMTAAGEVTLPDLCDSASGYNILIRARDVGEQVEVVLTDATDLFVLSDGTELTANDELDLALPAGSQVGLVCWETGKWYVVSEKGIATDGGVPD